MDSNEGHTTDIEQVWSQLPQHRNGAGPTQVSVPEEEKALYEEVDRLRQEVERLRDQYQAFPRTPQSNYLHVARRWTRTMKATTPVQGIPLIAAVFSIGVLSD
jgi:hypothetical protein